MKRSQKQRVERALRTGGRGGITAVDFLGPTTDGGPPVLRLPSRIAELKAQGLRIVTAGRRDKCVVYRMAESQAEPHPSPSAPPALDVVALFEHSVESAPPLSQYDPGAVA